MPQKYDNFFGLKFNQDHFNSAICTHADCISVAHLQCLAKSWLDMERRLCSKPTSFSSNPSCSPSAQPPPVSSGLPLVYLPASGSPASTMSILSPGLASTRLPPSLALLASLTGVSTTQTLPNLSPNPHPLPIPKIFGLGKGMFPRGGVCNSCGTYTLWGDIIKGCFRRSISHTAPKGSKRLPQTDAESVPDSGADSPWPTQFDMLTFQDVAAKRRKRVPSALLQRRKLPRRKDVLAQKAELDLAKQLVDKYRDVIRSKQARIAKAFRVATMFTPRRTRMPRKIIVSTIATATTTTVIALKKRGLGKAKKTLTLSEPSLPIPPATAPVKKRAREKAKKL